MSSKTLSREEDIIAGEETIEREGLKLWAQAVILWSDCKWEFLQEVMGLTHLSLKASMAKTASGEVLKVGCNTLTSVGIVAQKGENPIKSIRQGVLHWGQGWGKWWTMAGRGEKRRAGSPVHRCSILKVLSPSLPHTPQTSACSGDWRNGLLAAPGVQFCLVTNKCISLLFLSPHLLSLSLSLWPTLLSTCP